jgi:hypothetical protein
MRRAATTILLTLCTLGCPGDDGPVSADETGTTSSTGVDVTGTEVTTMPGPGSSSGDPDTSVGTSDEGSSSGGSDGIDPEPPLPCPDEWPCQADMDGDAFPLDCDNAPGHANPEQGDMDFDSIGDVVDLCPTVQSLDNTADSDRDGVGNDCDTCRMTTNFYASAGAGPLPAAFAFAPIPHQADADGDGIGDVCDNCVTVPNCFDYGAGTPYEVGTPIDVEDPQCQSDIDGDWVGEACEGLRAPGAAGPVGFGPTDDFDQDGLRNAVDSCPRQPVAGSACNGAAACPTGAACEDGMCTHVDSDGDGRGDLCDNCPWSANANQADEDGDFVGDACETGDDCVDRQDPRPFSFYDVSAGGWCCTTVYRGEPLFDPDGNALDPGDLPPLQPGVLELPPGCEDALALAGVAEATRLDLDAVASPEALWDRLCLLPQWDQDYDALGDSCDLCRYAFDPTNAPYVDDNGMTWPNDGAYCNGAYHCTNE